VILSLLGLVLDALVLATLVLTIASFWRTGRWLRKFRVRASRTGTMRAAVRAVGLDLVIAAAIAAAVVFGLGAVTGYVPLTPILLIFAAPDLAIWPYAIIAFFVARAIVRAICISVGRGTPQPASP
jgi:hypothetical protein